MTNNLNEGIDPMKMALPLPVNVSLAIKAIELSVVNTEIMNEVTHSIIDRGAANHLDFENWNKLQEISNHFAAEQDFRILCAAPYRILLESVRLITGQSLLDILYLGATNVMKNELSLEDIKFCYVLCDAILDKVIANPGLDISTLTLADLEARRA
jgi:hypothetical protein